MSNKIYDLVKEERRKRGLPNIYWSREMARLAQSQANYCAKVGHMVHSNRHAFQGGELLCGGSGDFSPRQVVNSWLNSKAGHREYMLSPRISKAGVGTARRNGRTFVAFAFSENAPSYPDCPYYKPKPVFKIPRIRIGRNYLTNKIKNWVSVAAIILGFFLLLARFDFGVAWKVIDFIHNIIPIDAIIIGADKFISWGLHLWYVPISFVLAGIIGLVLVNRKNNAKRHGMQKIYSRGKFSFGMIFSYVRRHKLLVLE